MLKIDPTIWRAARRGLEKAVTLYLDDPNVSFIDLGLCTHSLAQFCPETDLAVRIFVRQKLYEKTLQDFAAEPHRVIDTDRVGFAVEVIETDYDLHLRHELPIAEQELRQNKISGGKVRDRQSNEEMILTSWHALARLHSTGRRNALHAGLDAAVFKFDEAQHNHIGTGAVTGLIVPQLGMRVIKSDSPTGVTSGMITGILGYTMQADGSNKRMIGPLVHITPETPHENLCAPGDSGAWWLESSTRRAAAIHFAGGDQLNFALALSMPEVLAALKVEIVTAASSALFQSAQKQLPENIAPEAEFPAASAAKADASTAEAAVIDSSVKDLITAADLETINVMDRKYEERIHALVLNTVKLVLPTLAVLISALRKRTTYRLAQTGLLLVVAIMMIGFSRHLTKIHHQQNEQIDQLQNELQQAQTIAQIDSARQLQMRRIVSIIDRFNPEMEAELKFNIADEIYTMSLKYRQLDVDLICATITHETARTWNPEAISFAGALGLMQILPSTGIDLAQQEGIRWTSAEEVLFNPIYNVRLGCRYLEMLITDYGLEAGLAGYNGGGRQAKRWLRGGRADSLLHPETAYYVPAVLKIYREYRNTRL